MANKKCLKAILKNHEGEKLDAKLLGQIIDKMDSIRKTSKDQGEITAKSKSAREANEELAEFIEQRLLQDLVKRKSRFERYDSLGPNKAKAMESVLLGTRGISKGSLSTIDRKISSKRDHYMSMITMQLLDEDRVKLFHSGHEDLSIAKVLSELRKSEPEIDKLNVSEDAKAIAKAVRLVQDEMLIDAQHAGINIRSLEGFIVSQSHDAIKIRNLGSTMDESFKAWSSKILPLLDSEKTFPGADGDAGKLVMLRGAFDDIVNGRNNPAQTSLNDTLVGFKDLGPRAAKIEGSRKLHFSSPENFHSYNKELGKGNFSENLLSSINKYAKTTNLVEFFGVNPRAAFEADLKRMGAGLKGTALEKFNNQRNKLERMFDTVSGESDIPANDMLAQAAGILRAHQSVSKLGSVVAIAFTDLPLSMGVVASRTGENMFSTSGKLVNEFVSSFPKSQRKMAAEYFGLMANDMMGIFHSRIDAGDDALAGNTTKAMRMFFRWSGLSAQTEMARTAVSLSTSKIVANQIVKKSIHPSLKKVLSAFNIEDADMKFISKGIVELDNGQKIIDIRQITKLDSSVEARNAANNFRDFIIDTAEAGSPQPGQKEKFLITRGSKAGTIPGEVARSVLQFKSVPIKMFNTMFQIWDARANNLSGAANVAGTISGLTAMAYAADSAVRFSQNKEPRDPFDAETWQKAFVRGGAGGLYADMVLGEGMNFNSLLDTAAGPVISEASRAAKTIQQGIVNNKPVSGEMMNLLIRNTPGNNLIYSRWATDQMIFNHARKMADPKKERRRQRRLKKEELF